LNRADPSFLRVGETCSIGPGREPHRVRMGDVADRSACQYFLPVSGGESPRVVRVT